MSCPLCSVGFSLRSVFSVKAIFRDGLFASVHFFRVSASFKIFSINDGGYRKFVRCSRTNASRKSTRPRLSAKSRTPSVPVTSKPRRSAIVAPSRSSIKSRSACKDSASRIAARSPKSNAFKDESSVREFPLSRTSSQLGGPIIHDLTNSGASAELNSFATSMGR